MKQKNIDPERRHLVFVLAAAGMLPVLFAGCATPPPAPDTAESSIDHWVGRLSLNIDSSPPEQFYAAFELTGNAYAGRLALNSPLGNTIALLQWNPQQARLEQGGKSRSYASLDDLAAAVTGTAIPIRNLFAWLHGDNVSVAGWMADLDQLDRGRISAQRHHPAPAARLRVILEQES